MISDCLGGWLQFNQIAACSVLHLIENIDLLVFHVIAAVVAGWYKIVKALGFHAPQPVGITGNSLPFNDQFFLIVLQCFACATTFNFGSVDSVTVPAR